MKYKQCILKKDNKVDIALIPEKYAIIGKELIVRHEPEWVVTWISFDSIDHSILNVLSRYYQEIGVK